MSSDDGLASVQLHLVDDTETAGRFITWLSQRRPWDAVSVDIETGEMPGNPTTDAFSPWHGQIRLVQVGDGEQGWAIPWDEWKGVFYQAMSKYTGKIVCHNIAFEARWFAVKSHWTMPWHNAHDTMIMAHLIDPVGSVALKNLAAKHVDSRSVALQDTLKNTFSENGWTWGTVPINFQPYWSYGALDTVLTMRVFEKFYPTMCAPGMAYATPYELEMNTRRICTRMELNGARVDLAYAQKELDRMNEYSDQAKAWAASRYSGTSISSPIQLVRLFEELGAEITERTPSGAKSMNKDQLKMLLRDGTTEVKQLAEVVAKQRKADKLASSYFSNFLSGNIDGFVHPSIRTLGARTGRMSITEPALQTLPSGDSVVRKSFIPKDEDHLIISSDLDQVEFRITANLSGDQPLISLFHEADATGGDVFTDIMKQVYDDNTLVKEDPKRKLIKATVYGKLFGAGIPTMALSAGVAEMQMKSVVDAFDANYPGVKGLQKAIEHVGMQRLKTEGVGYVTTKTGRRMPCDDDRVYALTNYLIQSSAAEVFKANLVKLDQADLTENLIVPVHDEIVLQAHRDDVKEVMEAVQRCMTTTEGWEVPLTSGVEGPFASWGSKYEK